MGEIEPAWWFPYTSTVGNAFLPTEGDAERGVLSRDDVSTMAGSYPNMKQLGWAIGVRRLTVEPLNHGQSNPEGCAVRRGACE